MPQAPRIDELIARIEAEADPEVCGHVRELVDAIVGFHGDALRRMLELAGDTREFARDDMVSNLLLLHDLHPDDLATRVRRAVDRLPYVELAGVEQGLVRLRALRATVSREAVEEAVFTAAPDAAAVEIEGLSDPAFVPVESLCRVGLPACPGEGTGVLPHARAGREAYPTEHCELCGAAVDHRHPHLFETASRRLVCACDACTLLDLAPYRRVGRDVRPLDDFELTDAEWSALLIPIDLAFFVRSTSESRVRALYPGPAGITESLVSPEAWNAIARHNPALQVMQPDIEALLVNRVGEARDYYLAPLDRCYELTGLLRVHWRGLSGGEEAWREIAGFFRDLKEEAVHA